MTPGITIYLTGVNGAEVTISGTSTTNPDRADQRRDGGSVFWNAGTTSNAKNQISGVQLAIARKSTTSAVRPPATAARR